MTTVRVYADGTVEYGIAVPHEGANIPCGMELGLRRSAYDPDREFMLTCRKRVGHDTPKGEEPHVPVDYRIVATPPRVVHVERYKPNTLPEGVDQSITLPHDCAFHLPDVAEMEREVLSRGR